MKSQAGRHGDPRLHSDDIAELKAENARLRAEAPDQAIDRLGEHLAVIERMVVDEGKAAAWRSAELERSIGTKLRDLERRLAQRFDAKES